MYKSMSSISGGASSSSILGKLQSFFSGKTLIVIGVIVVLTAISVFYYYQYVAPKLNTSYVANKQPQYADNGQGAGQAEFFLFYVDWCPHCKTAKPEWEKVKQQYQGKSINGYNVIFKEVNCTNETPDVEKMISQYQIQGYPTLKLLKDGQVIDFDSKPTQDSLTQFLNSVL